MTTQKAAAIRHIQHTVIYSIVFLLLVTIAQADMLEISHFATKGLNGWERKSFKGETEYSIVKEGEGESAVVRARSSAAASGIYKKVQLDPVQYRYLHWKWKITEPLKNGAEKTKAGDDYAARVYVVFPGFFFWQSKAINYVWSSRLPREESYPSPFTRNVMMIVAQSGSDKTGRWITEQRDILADYRRLFGEEPRKLGAIAIMTDTDNSGGEAVAWYGDITISTAP